MDPDLRCLDLPMPRAKESLALGSRVLERQVTLEVFLLGVRGVGEPCFAAGEVVLIEALPLWCSLTSAVETTRESMQHIE